MWKPVAREAWPSWAVDLHSVWLSRSGGIWLTSKVNSFSSLWELRGPDGKVITNQRDLPFREGLEGAPVAWANQELDRRKGQPRG